MLIFPVALILAVLDTTLGAEPTPKRGLEDDKSRYSANVRGDKSHKSDKVRQESDRKFDGSLAYDEMLRKLLPYANLRHESQSEPFDKLFTMTASYKVANDKPVKQIDAFNQNTEGAYGAFPTFPYQFNQPLKSSDAYTPYFHTNGRKATPQNNQDLSTYLTSFQPLLNPTDYRFSFVGKAPKVNNVQQNSPFLSPFSSFHSQMVPISTTVNNPQFPQYKGASIQVYPAVGGFSTAAYQPLQAQPQLHFQHNAQRVQPVGGRQSPSQEIRSDVEIIDKHTTPPPKDDDEDEGHAPHDKEYSPDDDYEDKERFKAPRVEGDFKPSMSFPFKQYDEKFGKYQEEEIDEDDEKSKYESKDTSSKPYYSKQEEDDGSYERQETEESDYRPKNYEDFDEGFESSYRKKPKERYVPKESSRKGESGDPSTQENRMSFRYHRVPHGFQDNEGYGSDNLESVVEHGAFGYRIPKETRTAG
nr:PREDICTED: uncharacterized protein LOC105664096 [Megachile rotundata]